MTTAKNKIPFPIRIPFVETLGLELHGAADGHAELRCDLHEALTNSWEVAHGGVVMTMLDVAMAVAARTAHRGGQGVATIEMKTSFMRPAEGELRALGKLLHKTTTMAFCEATLVDVQFLRPSVALPRFPPGTEFHIVVGRDAIGSGKSLAVVTPA